MDEKDKTEDSSKDLLQNIEKSSKSEAFFKQSTEGNRDTMDLEVSAVLANEIAGQATDCINCTSGQEDTHETKPSGIIENIDFKTIFKGCSERFRMMNHETENINLKLTSDFHSSSEDDSGNINLETMSVASSENRKIIDQEADDMMEESSEPSVVKVTQLMDHETGNMTQKLKAFTKTNVAKCNEVKDLLSQITETVTRSPNITEESEDIHAPNSIGINELTDLKDISKQCTIKVNEEMRETVKIVNVIENSATTFDFGSKEDGERRNLEAILAPSNEIVNQANENVNKPGTSKAITVFSTENVNETSVPNENTAIYATDSFENLETSNVKEKIISGPKRRGRKRKAPPVSKMLITSIQKIKKNDGVSFEDIKRHMEINYPVKVTALVKYHVSNILTKFVEKGFLEKTGGDDAEKFIIKESEFMEI